MHEIERNDVEAALKFARRRMETDRWRDDYEHSLALLQDDPDELMDGLEKLYEEFGL